MSDKYCTEFLDLVNRPFDYHSDGRVPDGYPQNTLKVMDYYELAPYSLNALNSGSRTISAVGFQAIVGQGAITNVYNYNATSAQSPMYGWFSFVVDDTGSIVSNSYTYHKADKYDNGVSEITSSLEKIFLEQKNNETNEIKDCVTENDVGVTSASFVTEGTQNYETLFGVTSDTGYDTDGILSNFRYLSGGFRLWPTIEMNTNSTQLCVGKFLGCQMTSMQLLRASASGANIYTVMKECPQYKEFANHEGICARFNPFQEGPLCPLEINTFNVWNSGTFSTQNFYMPTVIVKLSINQTYTTAGLSMPFNFLFRCTLEGVLQTPSPIIASRPPLSMEWKRCLQVMSYATDKYPTVVSGHTYKPVIGAVVRELAALNPLTQRGYQLGMRMAKIYRASRPVQKKAQPRNNNKPKQKQKQKQKPRPQNMQRRVQYRPVRSNNRGGGFRPVRGGYRGKPRNMGNRGLNYNRNAVNFNLTNQNRMAKRSDHWIPPPGFDRTVAEWRRVNGY